MKNIFFLFLLCSFTTFAQHTFSIVAVDPATGEVGSAGATCLTSADCGGCGGAVVISGLVPGRGAMNAQATVCLPNSNLNIGITQMTQGDSPEEVLQYVLDNDNCQFGNTTNRQYGIADLSPDNEPRATAYTGTGALTYANHIIGDNYAIQGNILIGEEVLTGMQIGFENTEGDLAHKLMGAMQGAKIVGADSRCLDDGVSSLSSYLRLAKPDDTVNNYFLDLQVGATLSGVDPIDSLQSLFNASPVVSTDDLSLISGYTTIFPNPVKDVLFISSHNRVAILTAEIYTINGQRVLEQKLAHGNNYVNVSDLSVGIYFIKMVNPRGELFEVKRFVKK